MGKILSCPKRQELTPEEMRRRRLERYGQLNEDEVEQSKLNQDEPKTRENSLVIQSSPEREGPEEQRKASAVKSQESPKIPSNETISPERGGLEDQKNEFAVKSQENLKNPSNETNGVEREGSEEQRKVSAIKSQESPKIPSNQTISPEREGLQDQKKDFAVKSQESPKIPSNETKNLDDSNPVIKQEQEVPPEGELKIKKVASQPPDYIMNHPVYKEHGIQAYLTHTMFEEIFTFTIYEASIQQKPELKLLDNNENISFFNMENFEQIVQKVMSSETFYPKEGKLTFLYEVFNRLQNKARIEELDVNEVDRLSKILTAETVNYLESPRGPQESSENMLECTSIFYETLYIQLQNYDREKFLQYFILNLPDESLSRILKPIFKRILRDCLTIAAEETKYFMNAIDLLEAMLYLDKRVIEFFIHHPLFLPKGNTRLPMTGLSFQKFSIFGACLSFTTLPTDSAVHKIYFYDKETSFNAVNRRIDMLRSQMHIAVDCIHRIMEHMIKVDPKYKRNILDWFYEGLLLNNERQKMVGANAKHISTDGWFMNFMLLLLKFCEKILSDTKKYPDWLEKTDITYIQGKELFKDVQLLNNKTNNGGKKSAENSTATEDSEAKKSTNFLTELIFLANHALLLHKDLNKWYLEVFLKQLKTERKKSGPQSQASRELSAKQIAYEVQLQDPYLFTQIFRLFTFDVLLILQSYDLKIKDLDEIELLFEQTKYLKNEEFAEKPSLPFYWVENLQDYLPFIRAFSPATLTKSKQHFEILLDFILSVGKSGTWLGNAHLKAMYVRFMGSLLPPKETKASYKDESFRFLFKENPYFENHLVEGLVVMFVEVEKTGTHAQFYEKFSHRHSCCSIINYLLTTVFPFDRKSYVTKCLDEMAKKSYDMYLRFVMLYLNDIVCLLDEGFESLKKVKAYQDGTDLQNVGSLTEEEKQVREKNYQSNKGMVQYFSVLLNSYYEMGACVTKVSPDFFLTEEIKDKFIANLNNSLQSLNGRKATSTIKVNNYAELRFDPKFLLKNIAQTYLNFRDKEEFIRGVVNDERSFELELFYETARLLEKYSILDQEEIEPFKDFIVELEKKAQDKIEEDNFMKELTDIPDEFYDPITSDIMKDPVLLPTSNVICDRLTIMKHLLSDENDPFNRKKLTKEMLIPQPELQKRIQDFFKEKRENRIQNKDT